MSKSDFQKHLLGDKQKLQRGKLSRHRSEDMEKQGDVFVEEKRIQVIYVFTFLYDMWDQVYSVAVSP